MGRNNLVTQDQLAVARHLGDNRGTVLDAPGGLSPSKDAVINSRLDQQDQQQDDAAQRESGLGSARRSSG